MHGKMAVSVNRKGPQMTDQKYLDQLAAAERRALSRAAPQPSHGKTPPAAPKIELDPSHRARSVDDIAAKIERGNLAEREAKRAGSRARLAVSGAEDAARTTARKSVKGGVPDVGTGQTIIKLRQPPIAYLIDHRRIGAEERQAADEIALAFFTLSSRLMVKGIAYDRVDGGRGHDVPWPLRVAGAVANYQNWARLWSDRNKTYCDPTLEIVIAAVIDERPIRGIAQDLGFRPAKIARGVVCGLRDYAAHASIITGKVAENWRQEAEREFAVTPAAIRLTAYARAQLER